MSTGPVVIKNGGALPLAALPTIAYEEFADLLVAEIDRGCAGFRLLRPVPGCRPAGTFCPARP